MSRTSFLAWSREAQLAWAAGFFDGEGCISHIHNGNGLWYPRLSVTQKTPLLLQQFQVIVQCGKVGTRQHPNSLTPSYFWHLRKQDLVIQVLQLLWPYLGLPKRTQAHKVFTLCGELSNKRALEVKII